MKTIGNILWVLFGGIFIAIEYFVSSIILFITIVGIPFGIQTLKLAAVALWPFGKEIKSKNESFSFLSAIMNIIWFLIGGIWISLTHLAFGILFSITIIGLPFGLQHFKLAKLAIMPFGREII